MPRHGKRITLTLIGVLIILASAPFVIDLGYGWIVETRYRQWEDAVVVRSPSGVREGCDERRLGESATALLMVHGFGDCPALYTRMAPWFAARGYASQTMRLPGFGEPIERYRRSTREQWRQAMTRDLEALRRTHERVWIIAHSTAAPISVQVVDERPDLVDGMVWLAPLFGVSDRRSPVLSSEDWFGLLDRLFSRTRIIENPFRLDASDPDAERLSRRDRFIPVEIYRELFALIDEVRAAGEAVRRPLLVVVAEDDKVVDNRLTAAFLDTLAAPTVQRVALGATGHMIPLDSSWREASERIDAFIAEISRNR